jgi:acyl-homoserine-lactone acylase
VLLALAAALAATLAACAPSADTGAELAAWEQRARDVTITRDDWGIPHIHGKTDADAVFGLIYAQAEDDFNRIEMNYLNALGRTAEAEGESRIYQDLRMRLVVDHDSMKTLFASSPDWLRKLMTAWADGLNFFLATCATSRRSTASGFRRPLRPGRRPLRPGRRPLHPGRRPCPGNRAARMESPSRRR